jgi:hypothetical protein
MNAAAEYAANIGQDLCLTAELADFEAEQEVEDVDLMTTEQRQALNARMAEYFNG